MTSSSCSVAPACGADPQEHAIPLSYLYHHHLAPPAARPLPDVHNGPFAAPNQSRRCEKQSEVFNGIPLTAKAGANSLPPLLKGVICALALMSSDGAFLDKQFNTTDVCIIVKTELPDRPLSPPLRTRRRIINYSG